MEVCAPLCACLQGCKGLILFTAASQQFSTAVQGRSQATQALTAVASLLGTADTLHARDFHVKPVYMKHIIQPGRHWQVPTQCVTPSNSSQPWPVSRIHVRVMNTKTPEACYTVGKQHGHGVTAHTQYFCVSSPVIASLACGSLWRTLSIHATPLAPTCACPCFHPNPVGLKARAAGWQTPSPLLSPRNLKGAAVAALSPHPGLSPRPGASPRAATPPPQASAAALAAEILQRSTPQRPRTAARPQSPVGMSAASTAAAAVAAVVGTAAAGSSQAGQPGLRTLKSPSPAPPPAPAAAAEEGAQQPPPADTQASSSNALQQQQQQQAEAAVARSPLPRPVTSPFAAASGLQTMSRDASMSINFGVRGSHLQVRTTSLTTSAVLRGSTAQHSTHTCMHALLRSGIGDSVHWSTDVHNTDTYNAAATAIAMLCTGAAHPQDPSP